MVTIYTSPSCSSCRKVKKWFDEQHIPYKEKNIFTSVLDVNELKRILELSENGTDDIISKRSNIIKEQKVDIDSMTVNELLEFIKKNPSILKRPIMVDDRRIKVGYNSEEIRTFLPAARRMAELFCSHREARECCDGCSDCDCNKKSS